MSAAESSPIAKLGSVWRPSAMWIPACRRCGAPGVYQHDDKTWPIHYVPGKGGQSVGPTCLSCGDPMGKPVNYGPVPLGGKSLYARWTRLTHKIRWCIAEVLRRREVRRRQWT